MRIARVAGDVVICAGIVSNDSCLCAVIKKTRLVGCLSVSQRVCGNFIIHASCECGFVRMNHDCC